VMDKDNGRPVARAVVRLARRDEPQKIATFASVTDEDGVFHFAGLAPGHYDGFVAAPRHFITALTAGSPAVRDLVVSKGETLEVMAALPREYAISVRTVDAFGDPLAGLAVRVGSVDGRNTVALSLQRLTDDQGRLRVFGLAPGTYIVCAEPMAFGSSSNTGVQTRRDRLLPTCYPSASDVAQAEPVTIAHGDVDDVEIRMRRGRTATIAGTIVDASGAPATGVMAALSRHGENASGSITFPVDVAGHFHLSNVHPGRYVITVNRGGPDMPEQRRARESAFLELEVQSEDLEDLVVAMHRTVNVPGRVILEGGSALPPVTAGYPPVRILVRLADEGPPGSASTMDATVMQDGTFTLAGVFGRRLIDVVNVPSRLYVKSIRYGTKDVLDAAVEFKDGSDQPLEIVLSNRGATVTGTVVDDRGAPARAQVLLFRAPTESASPPQLAGTVWSVTGNFTLGPVREGDYLIVALPEGTAIPQPGQWDLLTRLVSLGERITLTDMDQRTMQLHVTSPER
jgi:5-hydroxyisourate hydrolase-like protein (transthyretin family)